MDQFPIPNRQHRRSNLGKRNRSNANPPRLVPVFQVPVARGLGRSRSGSKSVKKVSSQPIPSSQKDSTLSSYCAKKKLFLISPNDSQASSTSQDFGDYRRTLCLSPTDPPQCYSSNNVSLNETGINVLTKTPSPFVKYTGHPTHGHDLLTSPITNYSVYKKIEPPKSPGPSQYQYDRLLLAEFANIKPPIDPDDNIESMKSLSLKNVSPQQEPLLKSSEFKLPNPPTVKSSEISPLPLSEGEDSFLLAEQTIIEEKNAFNKSLNTNDTASKNILKKNQVLELVVEEETNDSDVGEELQQSLLTVDTMMEQMKTQMAQLEELQKSLLSLKSKISNKHRSEGKLDNKENVPVTDSNQIKDKKTSESKSDTSEFLRSPKCVTKLLKNKWMNEVKSGNPNLLKTPKTVTKQFRDRWMSELKSGNPSLLKTPKTNPMQNSFVDQTILWTPHSLSTVITDQMDELFE